MSFFRMILLALVIAVFPGGPLRAQDLLLPGDDTDNAAQAAEVAAQEFFGTCVEKPVIPTTEETDLAFCACASSNFQIWQSTPPKDSAQALLFHGLRNDEPDKNALLVDIYGPCLYIPLYDVTNEDCLNDERIRYHARTQDRLEVMCDCMASGVEAYFEKYAKDFLEMKIADGKDIDDPVRAIKQDVSFFDAHRNVEKSCYRQFHYEK